MTHPGYILVAWVVSLVAIGLYTTWLLVRGRTMSKLVPPARRRWMTTEADKS
jgi:hypothetical protein